jgi:predicted kinase
MDKELIIVLGVPHSGRTTWINKTLQRTESYAIVDTNAFPELYENNKLSEETIEKSREWAITQVTEHINNNVSRIVLSLINNRPDRWREFLQLAIDNGYKFVYHYPKYDLLFYSNRFYNSIDQTAFIKSKVLSRYPRDKKENKSEQQNTKTPPRELQESTLLKWVITEFQSSYSYIVTNKNAFGSDPSKWLNGINEQYKSVIIKPRSALKIAELKKEQQKLDEEFKLNKEYEEVRKVPVEEALAEEAKASAAVETNE